MAYEFSTMQPVSMKPVSLKDYLTSIYPGGASNFGAPLPWDVVDKTYEQFFKELHWEGREWQISDDQEINKQTLIDFKKEFLIYFYNHTIGYETVLYFEDQLGSWFRRFMPRYIKLMEGMNNDLFMTNDMTTLSNGNSESDTRSDSEDHNHTVTDSNTKSTSHDDGTTRNRQAFADTPQNELDIDIDNLNYASNVQVQDGKSTADGKADSETHSDTQSDGTGKANSNTKSNNENASRTRGRNADVFDIVSEWRESNYDQYLSIFDDIEQAGYFMWVYGGSLDAMAGGDIRGWQERGNGYGRYI